MRLIDADALERHPRYDAEGFEVGETVNGEDIDNAPTVEAYPFEQVQELVKLNQQFAQEIENLKRPKGKWVRDKDGYWVCSVCGAIGEPRHVYEPTSNYCHWCGVDMSDEVTCETDN